jgi:serine/threonine protein kinase
MNPNNFIELEIAAELRTGNQKGAQLVVVKGNMVAKIYDPLYYPAIDQLYKTKKDVVKNADKDYCCESTAYHELSSSSLESKVIPEYYGSWVMEFWQGGVRRQVPLILMEFIDGICMNDVDPKLLTEKQRNVIINEALVAEAQVYHYGGVSHKDFHPRNIIISPSPFSHSPCPASKPRVVLIDFNIAEVCRLANYVPSKDKRPKMQNPIVRHWGQLNDFSVPGWIPWHEDLGNREWLWNMFKDDPRFVEVRKKEGSWRWPEEAGVDY